MDAYSEKMKILLLLHYSRLSEKDRRQYAAIESIKLGYGGVTYISKLFGVSRETINQGKKELQALSNLPIPEKRQRRPGGGRKKNDTIS
jgi:hypothetical protein